MRTVKFYALIGTVIVAMLFVSCSKDDDDIPSPTPTSSLSDVEKSDLIKTVEIEKLHSDIYKIMSEKNQCEIFGDLCSCDESYTSSFSAIVDKYKLDNPIKELNAGVYADAQLQVKYNEFLMMSDEELKELLYFAKGLEEGVLADLESFMLQVKGNDDILELYLDLKEQTTCQLENINDRIDNKIPDEHPGNPGDVN